MQRFFLKIFLVVLVYTECQAQWKISVVGGVVTQHLRNPDAKIYNSLLKFRNSLYDWPDHLQLDETDYQVSTYNPWGFINKASCERKLMEMYEKWKNDAKTYFSTSEGFRLSGSGAITVLPHRIDENGFQAFNRLQTNSVYLTNVNYSKFKIEILRRRAEAIFSETSFYDGYTLQKEITDYIVPDTVKFLQAWDSAANPPVVKKNGLTLGVSGAYSKAIFPKVSSVYGFYTGVECFAEVNPNEAKSNGFSIKERSIGLRPFVGIIKKDNWAIYALGGVRCVKRDMKSDVFHVKKGKLAYEIGVGSDYILSERFSVSAKFIKGVRSKFNINGLSFQTSSIKVLLSLNYHLQ